MIPFEAREAIMKFLEGESFEGVEARYVGDATLDVAGATFRLTDMGVLMCSDGQKSCFGFYPDPEDPEAVRERFRMAVAWKLGVDCRKR